MTQKTEKELYELMENLVAIGLEKVSATDLVDNIKLIVDRNSSIKQVEDFMNTFNQKVRVSPEMPPSKECLFRLELCKEELVEAAEACGSEVLSLFGRNLYETSEKIRYKVENAREHLVPSLVGLLDALEDSQYVLDGFKITAGMQNISEEAQLEVHNSNMSKVCENIEIAHLTQQKYNNEEIWTEFNVLSNGRAIITRNSDKKVLKSINYKPAQLGKFINVQTEEQSSN